MDGKPNTPQDKWNYLAKNNTARVALKIILIVAVIWLLYHGISSLFNSSLRLILPNGHITAEVADTQKLRLSGLSGWDSLPDSEGMLFVFDSASTTNCFWMKDMKFAIDMVWLDADKHVVRQEPNVAPETYPSTFCPDSPAKYGLELGSGRAQDLKITPGAKLRW